MMTFAAPAAKAQKSMASVTVTGPSLQRAVRRPMLIRVWLVFKGAAADAVARGVDMAIPGVSLVALVRALARAESRASSVSHARRGAQR
ncbi:hypothetical protein MKUB_09940 [Mycobacterium kubicae]|uniref:Uncharacterized protein n=1 Tax=Mycobacterium kubicae TaxID=120959 RepID=A0ABQ1BIK8_9MYCO|nr:hypothetical protein MKUB_09940 [Mycobacterium kubicae]